MISERKQQEAVCVGSLIAILCIIGALAVMSLLSSCSSKRQASVRATESVEASSVSEIVKVTDVTDIWTAWRNFMMAADTTKVAVSIDSLVTPDGVKLYGAKATRTDYAPAVSVTAGDSAARHAVEVTEEADSADYRASSSLESSERTESKPSARPAWTILAALIAVWIAVVAARKIFKL